MKRVLIITYYWRPSGGAGVQRWLKMTKYLMKEGYTPVILTVNPDKASYSSIDQSLLNDVAKDVEVHTTTSFEPLNIYASIFGKKTCQILGMLALMSIL